MNDPWDVVFEQAVRRYREGTCRDRIVHDFIMGDAARLGSPLTMVDIGCGKGFDTDIPLQQSLVRAATHYIGIEPDLAVTPGEYIKDVRRCLFEQADLRPSSVHLAFAVMVLEHLEHPQSFWDELHEVLVPGGVFWALTVDARHWFCRASLWAQRLRLKGWYLSWLLGARGQSRYEDYPVFYRSNVPADVERYGRAFASIRCFNLARVGQCDEVFPRFLRPLSQRLEAGRIRRGKPGTLLVIRAAKAEAPPEPGGLRNGHVAQCLSGLQP
jgi:SAM-dependent methyltransferase